MKYYLVDAYPEQTDINRFYISTTRPKVFNKIWTDNSYYNLVRSWKLLLTTWERLSLPRSMILASKQALSVRPRPILEAVRKAE